MGAYVARRMVIMPHGLRRTGGAYVDEGTMSGLAHTHRSSVHAVGKHIILGCCTEIGGVLEPVNASAGSYQSSAGGRLTSGTIVRAVRTGPILTQGAPR